MLASPRTRDVDLVALMFCSGAAALGYEVLWSDALALILGSDARASVATLAGYFAGVALGAWWIHARLRRDQLDAFGQLAKFEAIAAVFAATSPWLLANFAPTLARFGPTALPLRMIVAALLILPGTFCVGTILPLALEGRRRARAHADQSGFAATTAADFVGAGRLYAAYTIGGVGGLATSAFVWVPRGGLPLAGAALAGIGLLSAALAWRRRGTLARAATTTDSDLEFSNPDATSGGPRHHVDGHYIALAGIGGALGIAVETLGLLVIGQVASGTVYTFAIVVGVFLVFTAIGSALSSVASARDFSTPRLRVFFALIFVAAGLALGTWFSAPLGHDEELVLQARDFVARCRFELSLSVRLLALPSLGMGFLYAQVLGAVSPRGTGRAVALNGLGAAVGPFVVAWFVLPAFGLTDGWVGLAFTYVAVAAVWSMRLALSRGRTSAVLAVPIVTMFVTDKNVTWVKAPRGWVPRDRVATLDGVVMLATPIVEPDDGRRPYRLQIDQLFRMGGAQSIGEQRMGALSTLIAPNARRVLVLGVGTGATAGSTLLAPIESLDAVELVDEVFAHLDVFDDVNHGLARDPRATLHGADARAWLARSDQRWDLIVGDLFHPERDGAGRLFAREHFVEVRHHLSDAGVFVQWLPLHQLDAVSFAAIVRAFLDSFPAADGYLALYNAQTPAFALVGSRAAVHIDRAALRERLADPRFAALAIVSSEDVFAGHIIDRAGLEALAGDQAPNRDLDPIVSYRAPRKGADPHRGADRLEAVLAQRASTPSAWAQLSVDSTSHARHRDYADAVAAYLRGEIEVARGGDPQAAAEHWLRAFGLAPDFRPARARLLALARSSPQLAPRLLRAMAQLAPQDPQLREMTAASQERPRQAPSLEGEQARATPAP